MAEYYLISGPAWDVLLQYEHNIWQQNAGLRIGAIQDL